MEYDLNLARRWMKPIRILLELELANGQHVVSESSELDGGPPQDDSADEGTTDDDS